MLPRGPKTWRSLPPPNQTAGQPRLRGGGQAREQQVGDWLSEPSPGLHLLGREVAEEVDRGSQLLSDSSTDSGLVCFIVLGGLGVDTELGVEAGEEHGVAREAVLHPPSLNVSG